MEHLATTFRRELDALATIRDELKLKAHLASNDVHDELRELESKLTRANETLQQSLRQANEGAILVKGEIKATLVELSSRYERIKRLLSPT